MTARALPLYLLATALALALAAAACGGGGDGEQPTGRLTDPRSVATATPWAEPPEPIILPPGALTPISDNGDGGGDGVEVTPVTSFQITVADSANRRKSPSTQSDLLGTINAGEKKTVTGEVPGEAVEADNDIWYALEDGSFVYSGAVTKVEE